MGWVNPTPPLNAGEQVRWKKVALYSLETSTVSGTLYLTTTDLLFMPNRFSGRFKDYDPQRIPVHLVADVGIEEPTGMPYNGGLRRRVRIKLCNEEVHLFVIKHPDQAAHELQALLANESGVDTGRSQASRY